MKNTPVLAWHITADALVKNEEGDLVKVPMTSCVVLPEDHIQKEYDRFTSNLSKKMAEHPLDMSKVKCPERDEYLSSNGLQ